MKLLYFSGTAGAGKTAIALGVGLLLQEKGLKIGFFKPLGLERSPTRRDDNDVALMREIFKIPFSSETISPVKINPYYLTPAFLKEDARLLNRLDKALESFGRQEYDVLLIEGAVHPFAGAVQELDDFSLAARWKASVLLIASPDKDYYLDQLLLFQRTWDSLGANILGCVFNKISRPQLDKTRGIYKPLVERRKIDVLGIIPCRPEIASPTVGELQGVLEGEVLAAPEQMHRLVEEIVIGTMTMESALGYLRRAPNKALITGGDRSDLALTALETSTSVIILTGGLYPDVRVLSKAEEKGVPVILVQQDTYSTVESLHRVYRRIHPHNGEAVNLIKSNINEHVDWGKIYEFATS